MDLPKHDKNQSWRGTTVFQALAALGLLAGCITEHRPISPDTFPVFLAGTPKLI